MMDMSPTSDAEIAAENAAKVAALVKKLHEPPHGGFFGQTAEQERVHAPTALANMEAYSAIPDLAFALKDKNHEMRANAAEALSIMADHASAAEGALREALKDDWSDVRLYAAWGLRRMDVGGVELLPIARDLCQSNDMFSAVRAADLGIAIEQDPKEFIPCLMRGMDDPFQGERVISVMSEEKQYREYLPVLLKGARSATSKVRSGSVNLLGAGIYASPEVTGLLRDRAVSDPSEDVRMNAVQSLVTGGEGSAPGIPAGTAEGTADETIALLVKLVKITDWQVAKIAAEALGCAKNSSPEVINALIATSRNGAPDARVAAVRALGSIGPPASAALPTLTAALQDYQAAKAKGDVTSEQSEFGGAVEWAIRDIGAKPEGGS